MVFGQIDGYSRPISSLHIFTDNRAETALRIFIDSIREYGVRSRVRADGGSEFNHINFLMDKLNGDNRRNLIRDLLSIISESKDCGVMFSRKLSTNTTDYFRIWKQKVL